MYRVERRQRLRLVKGRQVGEVAKRGFDLRIDAHGGTEAVAAVDDSVSNRIWNRHLGERLADRARVDLPPL